MQARSLQVSLTRRGMKLLQSLVGFILLLALPPGLSLATPESKPAQASIEQKSSPRDPSALEERYRQRVATNPNDVEAYEGLAILQTKHGEFPGAVESYRRVLALTPNNRDARLGLGRTLALSGQYPGALTHYRGMLAENPHDGDALEGMAQVHLWSGHPEWALPIYAKLAVDHPGNSDYSLGLGRAQIRLHHYAEARSILAAVLKAHPHLHEAELQLADLDIYQGHFAGAWRRYNQMLKRDPTDRAALEGNARVAYYRGDLEYARKLTSRLVEDSPRDTEFILLLAREERALHNTNQARALVSRTESIDPGNSDARDLENSLNEDARTTLHTSASYAREITSGSPSVAEDLSTMGFENTWGGLFLPRSQVYISVFYLPSQSPSGGTQGSVAPWQVLYRQTTYLYPHLTLRYGAGLVRFGPSGSVAVPNQQQPITSAGARPLGFGDLNYAVTPKLSVDFGIGRNAITYTPVATHLGVMEDRLSLGMDYRLNAKTDFSVESYLNKDLTAAYGHGESAPGLLTTGASYTDVIEGAGTTLRFDRKVIQRFGVAVDLGYDGLLLAYMGNDRPYLGFFTPGFFQRHYLTSRFSGKLYRRVGYEFYSGVGVQQVERGTRMKSAYLLSPSLTFKANDRLTVGLGYSHYNNSESLGTLSGDAVRLTTDWRF